MAITNLQSHRFTLSHTQSHFSVWLGVTGCDSVWLSVIGCDWVWLGVTECDWVWLYVTVCDCVWLSVTVCDCMWLCVTGDGPYKYISGIIWFKWNDDIKNIKSQDHCESDYILIQVLPSAWNKTKLSMKCKWWLYNTQYNFTALSSFEYIRI